MSTAVFRPDQALQKIPQVCLMLCGGFTHLQIQLNSLFLPHGRVAQLFSVWPPNQLTGIPFSSPQSKQTTHMRKNRTHGIITPNNAWFGLKRPKTSVPKDKIWHWQIHNKKTHTMINRYMFNNMWKEGPMKWTRCIQMLLPSSPQSNPQHKWLILASSGFLLGWKQKHDKSVEAIIFINSVH